MAQPTRLTSEIQLAARAPGAAAGSDARLQEMLKHCDPATYEAAAAFRKLAGPEHLRTVVRGVISGYVDPELRGRLTKPPGDLRLVEDLGLDSLTLMEIALRLEDVLQIAIKDDEPRNFRTLADIQRSIERLVAQEATHALPATDSRWQPDGA